MRIHLQKSKRRLHSKIKKQHVHPSTTGFLRKQVARSDVAGQLLRLVMHTVIVLRKGGRHLEVNEGIFVLI